MNDRNVSILAFFVAAGMLALLFALTRSGESAAGIPGSVGSSIDALPPSGAGIPTSFAPAPVSAPAQAPQAEAYLGGTVATGRVAQVYLRVAENVFLAVDQAPEHLRHRAERWVDVQFPELLANSTESARAVLERGEAGVRVGDVVEIKFAHKDNPRYFPVKEVTRVTALVASRDQMLAKDIERRILARSGHAPARPEWLSQATAPQPAANQPVQTAAADAER
jgi:hypothetical protein